ncbi:MAG: TIGR04222 domain-containing membrane protein [Verrucomicrobia bacterium]|nr:TIGR04222 domain-containing membrane protein [Verrucomicrobiota bacterium]
MNPLDLSGPAFLGFYLALLVLTGVALRILRNLGDGGSRQATAPELTDPYLIACLRGGAQEVWRVATVTLLDRGLLTATGSEVRTKTEVENTAGSNEVERATLSWFRTQRAATSIFKETTLAAIVQPYEEQLIALSLLPSESQQSRRHLIAAFVVAGMVTLTVSKIAVAFSRGHHNILFLLLLTFFGCLVLWGIGNPRRTRRGDAILEDLARLFARLKTGTSSLKAGKTTNELIWTAAIFGLAILPSAVVPQMQSLYPTGTSSGGSSCGSSGGSSCGSSCGGGCGGGCGGCGS